MTFLLMGGARSVSSLPAPCTEQLITPGRLPHGRLFAFYFSFVIATGVGLPWLQAKKLDSIHRYSLSSLHERGIGLKSLGNRFEKLCKRLSLMTSPRGTELDIRLPLSGKLA
jgi:hypothetical protein